MDFKNNSPWLAQLNRIRPLDILNSSQKTDISIIGGGIAGVVTAYFILKNTRNKVILIESNKIAHGATGHNAGQIVGYFERPFSDLVKEYGLKNSAEAQKNLLQSWPLIKKIYKEANIKTPKVEFIGYAGCSDFKQLNKHLENKYLRRKAGIDLERVFISDKADTSKIDKKYKDLYKIVSQEKIQGILETKDNQYFAALGSKKGLVNSAVFTEELVGFLLKKYKKRFTLFEHSKIEKIRLYKTKAESVSGGFKIYSKKVVLCTNGFENIKIIDETGKGIDSKFHKNIYGLVGYMAGYKENSEKQQPTAISFFPKDKYNSKVTDKDSYFYITRRKFSISNKKDNLLCVGGPELKLQEGQTYLRDYPYFDIAEKEIEKFMKKTYKNKDKKTKVFKWHGLMGYTRNKIRIIGPEPCNGSLLYNLGCNGAGILSSIYGGYKISLFLNNKVKKPSIFDPFNSVCKID